MTLSSRYPHWATDSNKLLSSMATKEEGIAANIMRICSDSISISEVGLQGNSNCSSIVWLIFPDKLLLTQSASNCHKVDAAITYGYLVLHIIGISPVFIQIDVLIIGWAKLLIGRYFLNGRDN